MAPALPGPIDALLSGDAVSHALLLLLLLMSVASWAVILGKGGRAWRGHRRSERWLARFREAPSIDAVATLLQGEPANEPFAALTLQALHACGHRPGRLPAPQVGSGAAEELVVRRLRTTLDALALRLESGLSLLATVGATAPFVGLLGTVWGVHHALAALGHGGPLAIDRVAGPVGEALVMTAVGLAVAIPAVVAYNAFARRQRLLVARLEGHAFELIQLAGTGQAMHPQPAPAGDIDPQRRPVLVGA